MEFKINFLKFSIVSQILRHTNAHVRICKHTFLNMVLETQRLANNIQINIENIVFRMQITMFCHSFFVQEDFLNHFWRFWNIM